MRSLLKGTALVLLGILISITFQFTVNFQYVHVFQTPTSGNQRQVTLSFQPFHPSPVIDLFGNGNK